MKTTINKTYTITFTPEEIIQYSNLMYQILEKFNNLDLPDQKREQLKELFDTVRYLSTDATEY